MNQVGSVLVTDFDGTVTEFDFYRQASPLLPRDLPDYWEEYRGGRMTHFEALAAIFKHLTVTETELMAVARSTRPDPKFAESVGRLQEAGWEVVVCSAGCKWYIERLLAEQGLNLAVHGNPGIHDPARGLEMLLPADSPYFSPSHGIDKAALVRDMLATRDRVAFAGDGYPDQAAAVLVADEFRFARGALAEVLNQKGIPFHSFATWSEIARTLLRD